LAFINKNSILFLVLIKLCTLDFYRENLDALKAQPTSAQQQQSLGRTLGNLGNVHYLLGDFEKAIEFHTQRLEIATEFGDLHAMRRARTNLGNAHVFSGRFEEAATEYL